MAALPESVRDFLEHRRIAVVGVSRDPAQPANAIYRKLRDAGYEVFAVNPNAERAEGDACYASLAEVPVGVDGVVVATHPAVTGEVVEACGRLGIRRVWMHRSFGTGSVSQEAVERGRALGLEVIEGGCPLMFCPPVDVGHRCMRAALGWMGRVPR